MIIFKENELTPNEWCYLRKSIKWTIHDNDDFSLAIKNSLFVIGAYDGNQIIGMARITGDDRLSFFIQDIIVLPAYQNQGVGTKIVRYLMDYIYSKSAPNAAVSLMASKGKETFYEMAGFIKRDGSAKGYGMELIINPN